MLNFKKEKGLLKHKADIATELKKKFSLKLKIFSDRVLVARKTKRFLCS